MTARDLITDALKELGVVSQGEPALAGDASDALGKLNRLIDNWNAEREAIYADQLLPFTLTPSLQPHTIGPTGATWTTTQRPVSIEGITLFLASGATYVMTPRTSTWWQEQIAPTETSDIPTDFYYQPSWGNGAIYFWPVPTAAYDVQLLVRGVLSAYTLNTTFTLPPGYQDALTLTLAESCAAMFGTQAQESTVMAATKARARIFANNVVVPRLVTQDAGMPSSDPAYFDYRIGMTR